jgi:hypothetical protein
MKRVIGERKRNNKVTIVVNRNNFELFKLSGKIMLFTPFGIEINSAE